LGESNLGNSLAIKDILEGAEHGRQFCSFSLGGSKNNKKNDVGGVEPGQQFGSFNLGRSKNNRESLIGTGGGGGGGGASLADLKSWPLEIRNNENH
jgi:hypothetical protein